MTSTAPSSHRDVVAPFRELASLARYGFQISRQALPVFLVIFLAAWAYYYRAFSHHLTEDDLRLWQQARSSSFLGIAFGESESKFRPVSNALLYVLVKTFDTNYIAYCTFNVALLGIMAFLVWYLVRKISGSGVLGISAAVVATFARFAWYDVSQIYGAMEAELLILLLVMCIFLERVFRLWRPLDTIMAAIFAGLGMFAHERLIVLSLVVAWIGLIGPWSTFRTRLTLIVVALVPAFLNVVIKILIGVNFLTGTGGTTVSPSFYSVSHFAGNIVLNSVGVPWGPLYLSATNFASMTPAMKGISLLVAASVVALASLWISSVVTSRRRGTLVRRQLTRMSTWVVAYLVLVLSSSITIRVEMRWVFAPFIILLIAIAQAVTDIEIMATPVRRVSQVLVGMFLVGSLVVNVVAYQSLKNSFFQDWIQKADARYALTYGQHGEALLVDTMYFVGGDTTFDWNAFLKPYWPADNRVVYQYVPTVNDIPATALTSPSTLIFVYQPPIDRYIEVPAQYFQIH